MECGLLCFGRDCQGNLQIAFCLDSGDADEWSKKYSLIVWQGALIDSQESLNEIQTHISQQLTAYKNVRVPIALNDQIALRYGEAEAISDLLRNMVVPEKPIEWSLVSE